jgi:hypothetical protein
MMIGAQLALLIAVAHSSAEPHFLGEGSPRDHVTRARALLHEREAEAALGEADAALQTKDLDSKTQYEAAQLKNRALAALGLPTVALPAPQPRTTVPQPVVPIAPAPEPRISGWVIAGSAATLVTLTVGGVAAFAARSAAADFDQMKQQGATLNELSAERDTVLSRTDLANVLLSTAALFGTTTLIIWILDR